MLTAIVSAVLGTGLMQDKPPTLAQLDKLVATYKELKLPIPKPDAPLVVTGEVSVGDENGTRQLVNLGYLVQKIRKGGMVLDGTILKLETSELKPFVASVANAARVQAFCSQELFGQESRLVIAVVERTRGNDAFALEILKDSSALVERGYLDSDDTLESRLLDLAVSHWMNCIVDPTMDRSMILENLNALTKRNPSLNEDFFKRIMSGLRETVSGRYKGSNEIEKLIDALCDSKDFPRYGPPIADVAPNAALTNLAARGFEVMPALIQHFDDKRLTRGIVQGFGNAGPRIMSVGEACFDLASQLCPEKTDGGWGAEDRELVRKWWSTASNKPDRENGLAALLKPAHEPTFAAIAWASKRDPSLLMEAYDTIVDQGRPIQTYKLLGAMKPVFETSLYTDAAIRGCKSKNLNHVHSSLWSLHEVNKTEFDHQLVRLFERLPTAIAEDQTIWLSRESSFAQLAAYSESPSVWAALTAATKRAEVNLRLQLIDHAARGRLTPSSRKEFHKYLLAFFGDTSRSEPGGPKRGLLEREAYEDHGFLHSRRVQDLAAAIAAQDMEVKGIPDESASRTVWDEFRAKIAGLIQVSLSKG